MLNTGFIEVLDKYNDCRKSQPGVDKSSSVYELIHKTIPAYLERELSNEKYLVEGSVGVGRWADVPWVGIFNKNITTSAQEGFYICYLFSNDMNSVFLTIIHSITKDHSTKNWGKKEIQSFVQSKRDNLISNVQDFGKYTGKGIKIEKPSLFGNSERAKKYSESTIAYKQYLKNEMPSEETLLKDLKLFVELYGEMEKSEEIKDSSNSEKSEKNNISELERIPIVQEGEAKYLQIDPQQLLTHIHTYITAKGFNFSKQNIINLYLSLRSKPFVIISGISGTGKTKIVQLFAESIGANEDNGQLMLVPVRPDWSDSSELLGYTDIKGDFIEGQLSKLIKHAIEYPERPHFLLLDEMNLARVEYYFSDILSVMESRGFDGEAFTSSKLQLSDNVAIYLPGNVYIIGTVNMDETTHPFSKKVLDRANTIEFNEIDLNTFGFLQEQKEERPIFLSNASLQAHYIQLPHIYEQHQQLVQTVSQQLTTVNGYLKEIYAQVGYRVRDEICFYMAHNVDGDMLLSEDEAFDFCLMQKILPRIAGSGTRVEQVLNHLQSFMENRALPRSKQKLEDMQRRLHEDEFTSFWIS